MLETTSGIPTAPEFSLRSKIPILPHPGCSSSIGTVTKLDDLGKPKNAKCINSLCGSGNVMIDWNQMQVNRFLPKPPAR